MNIQNIDKNNGGKPPYGYRRVTNGETIRAGDKYLSQVTKTWKNRVGEIGNQQSEFIRPTARKIEVPIGHRLLEAGELIQTGDVRYSVADRRWYVGKISLGQKAGEAPVQAVCRPVAREVVSPVAPAGPKVPEGYRLLEVGEIIRAGDIYHTGRDGWLPRRSSVGSPQEEYNYPTARKTEATNTREDADGVVGPHYTPPVGTVIPKGWRRLGSDEKVLEGDRVTNWGGSTWHDSDQWQSTGNQIPSLVYIRKEAPQQPHQPRIPEGWRKLEPQEDVVKGDKYWGVDGWTPSNNWGGGANTQGETCRPYIRKEIPKQPEIPKGWRLLGKEEPVLQGDKYFCPADKDWCLSGNWRAGSPTNQATGYPYIRKELTAREKREAQAWAAMPKDHRRLAVGEEILEGDLIWSLWNGWRTTSLAGDRVVNAFFCRPTPPTVRVVETRTGIEKRVTREELLRIAGGLFDNRLAESRALWVGSESFALLKDHNAR